jgi:tetratricopeptide (TPR) repeat protein
VVQIIRTCNFGLLIAALLTAAPSSAKARRVGDSALRNYAMARVAQQSGDSVSALERYAVALANDPRNQDLALRVTREAVKRGNLKLALQALAQLDKTQQMPPDIELLIIAERIRLGDWRGALLGLGRLEEDKRFANMGPIMRAWVALSMQGGEPFKALDLLDKKSYESLFSPEHRAYLLMATGSDADGLTLVRALALAKGGLPALRLSAASALIKAGKREEARAFLSQQVPELIAARAYFDNGGKALPPQIKSTAQGVAQFMARYSAAFLEERAPNFALIFARYARYLDPENPFVALAEARAIAGSGMAKEAEGAFAKLVDNPIIGSIATAERLDLLEVLGRRDEAIDAAQRLASAPRSGLAEQVRLGDILARAGRYADANRAYDSALKASDMGDGSAESWALWYLKGSALDRGGDWPAGKAALQKSIALAPNQPAPLNYLGYGMLERRENLGEALTLVKRAYALNPTDIGVTDSLGWALYLNGDYDNAIDALERVVLAEPVEPTLGEHLGDVYWSVGRRVDARYAWRAASIYADGDAAARLKEKMDFGLNQKNAAR